MSRQTHPLSNGLSPAWASGWGEDEFGVFAEFAVGEVVQRMRWIPPGGFMMGSPDDESGRFDNEGPLHEVEKVEGFWLFDTPVTQALWEAVMGSNPSYFVSSERPVEQVSWNDVGEFTSRLHELIPGLALRLPSESQWEYACRAGTETALYSGDIAYLSDANAPALDPIAWYVGNSGVDFELSNGFEPYYAEHSERQYPDTKESGTHAVKGKQPNAWGLYDMLGNVWEWVQDEWHYDYRGAPDDGGVWKSGKVEAHRVLRGGSWLDPARGVRCACRGRDEPGVRGNDVGFRLARVQGELKQEQAAQGERPGEPDVGEPGPERPKVSPQSGRAPGQGTPGPVLE